MYLVRNANSEIESIIDKLTNILTEIAIVDFKTAA